MPPPPGLPFRIISSSVSVEWCQACALPSNGGGGYLPSAPRLRQPGVASPFGPWQLAQFLRYTASPRLIFSGSNLRAARFFGGSAGAAADGAGSAAGLAGSTGGAGSLAAGDTG